MADSVRKTPEEGNITVSQRALKTLINTVESNQQMLRACFMLLLLLIIAIILLEYFRREWKEDFELHFPLAGSAIILHSSANTKDFKSAVFLVPASKCWVNTGLVINKGDHISIRASGHVHLAVKQIEQEKIPNIPWSGPNGSPFVNLNGINRSEFLIHQSDYDDDDDANHGHSPRVGNLVGYFLPVNEAENEGAKPSKNKPRPSGVFHIGSYKDDIINDTGRTAHLWLCVNDLVLEDSPKAKEVYLEGDSATFIRRVIESDSTDAFKHPHIQLYAQKLWKDRKNEWTKIKKDKAWDLYYYDNIGHYLVTIEKQ